MTDKQSSIYIGHGAPTNAIESGIYQTDLRNYAKKINPPDNIVVISAHWENYLPLYITSAEIPGIIYDFSGFQKEMYELEYNSRGNPLLAEKIHSLLESKGILSQLTEKRGLDHGAWVPLKIMYPEANIPVIQISMPVPRNSKIMYKIGQVLTSLREENVLFIGSGNLVHNIPYAMKEYSLGKVDFGFHNTPNNWAKESDDWIKEKLDNQEIEEILDSPLKMPNFRMAAPTTEHFDPIYFTLGTLSTSEGINYFHESFQAGSFSMRSFALEN